MALAKTLPIYKVAFDLLSIAMDYVQNMPRPFKAAVGGRLRDLCIDTVLLIVRANIARDKRQHLDALREGLAELELLLRICQEKRFISKPQYARAIELTDSVGRQATGWSKHAVSSPVA